MKSIPQKSRRTRALKIEALEAREVCTGDVTVTYSHGMATILGDNAGNTVGIRQLRSAAGVVNLELDGNVNLDSPTTFNNGGTTFPLRRVQGISLQLGQGDDVLQVKNGRYTPTEDVSRFIQKPDVALPGNVSLGGGIGRDKFSLYFTNQATVIVNTGNQNDLVHMHASVNRLTVQTNAPTVAATDAVFFDWINATGAVSVTGSAGNDTVEVSSTSVLKKSFQANLGTGVNRFSTTADKLSTPTNADAMAPTFRGEVKYDGSRLDTVAFRRGTFLGPLTVTPATIPFSTAQRRTLTSAEFGAVQRGLDVVRAAQLPDGALREANDGSSPDYINVYFGEYTVQALLASVGRFGNLDDLERVRRWLEWQADHQNSDGVWDNFNVLNGQYSDADAVDAWDSSAALYLLGVGRFYHAGGVVSSNMLDAVHKAMNVLIRLKRDDGLVNGTPSYHVALLLDETEVYAGLRAIAPCFAAIRDLDMANAASDLADSIKNELGNYFRPVLHRYAHAKFEDGTYQAAYIPLAQLFGISCIAPKSESWDLLNDDYPPEDNKRDGSVFSENMLEAATRISAEAAQLWRQNVVNAIPTMDSSSALNYRYSVAALALMEGADWFPSVAGAQFNNKSF